MWIVPPTCLLKVGCGSPSPPSSYQSVLNLTHSILQEAFKFSPSSPFYIKSWWKNLQFPILIAIKCLLRYPPSFTNETQIFYFFPGAFYVFYENIFIQCIWSHPPSPNPPRPPHIPTYPTLLFFFSLSTNRKQESEAKQLKKNTKIPQKHKCENWNKHKTH